MIASLLRPDAYDHPVQQVQLLETHISWILLTGSFAYKLRKPLNLGFVDQSTPERRRHGAEEELRLNRRLCPDLYLGLRPVYGPVEQASLRPRPGAAVIDVAVQMQQFDQADLLSHRLAGGSLPPVAWHAFADRLARFHGQAAVAAAADPWGDPARVLAPALANLEVLAALPAPPPQLPSLQRWTAAEHGRLQPLLEQRRRQGRVREGHGDLHLGNLVWRHERIEAFDCLEFSEALRWIDVISDVAFLAMDLCHQGHPRTAASLLNHWLLRSGDHLGLATWRWYAAYRALVRAKVSGLRLMQMAADAPGHGAVAAAVGAYTGLAEALAGAPVGPLLISHGVSGTGKSWLSAGLCERLGWIHLRADGERRRLFGDWGELSHGAPRRGDPYSPAVTEELYLQLLPALATAVVQAGFGVIVDATFLRAHHRRRLADVAAATGSPFLILDLQGMAAGAAGRIAERRLVGTDPSQADERVLASQLDRIEPLSATEQRWRVGVEPMNEAARDRFADGLAGRLQRLRTTR